MSANDEMAEMAELLERFFAVHLPDTPRISNVTKTSSGRSRQNWNFDLTRKGPDGPVVEPLILRRDPEGGLVQTDREREFSILSCLQGTAVPAPTARWLDPDGKWFGHPALIMKRERGRCDYYVLNGERPLQERVGLAERFCDLLIQVHAADLRRTGLADALGEPPDPALVQLTEWETVLHSDQVEPYPEVELALQWLREARPACDDLALVHGDFKPGNILLEGGQITALLDWELAHVGDPAEDLGWVTQPLRKREHMIAGHWEEDQIIERYESGSGRHVPRESVRWWQVFAAFRTAVMQASGLRSFLEGRSAEPYRPTARVLQTLLEGIDYGSPE